jgi:hypothetical protein
MTTANRPRSYGAVGLAELVSQAELGSLVGALAEGLGAAVFALDVSGRRLAGSAAEGQLAQVWWREGDPAPPEGLTRRLDAAAENPATVPVGRAAVLLVAFVEDGEERAGAIVAGPVLTVAGDALAASPDLLDELAAEMEADPSAVSERIASEPAWTQERLRVGQAALLALARALSLLLRFGRDARRKQAELEALCEIGAAMTSTLDVDRVLEQVLDRAIEQTGARGGSVMLVSPSREYLTIAKARGLSDQIVQETKVPMGEGISGWVAQENKPRVMLRGVRDLLSRSPRAKAHMTSALSVPIRAHGRVIGVINVNDCTHAENFDESDLHILQMLSVPAGIALENARIHQALRAESQGAA